jgi:archaellum component FlaC
MAGGSRHTGAYISRMGTKWNELDEEMAAMRGESSKMGNDLDGVNGFYLYYEDNVPNDVKKYFSDTATKLIFERITIKSLEYLGNEVIRDYPYLADEVKQKLGGIKFVKK